MGAVSPQSVWWVAKQFAKRVSLPCRSGTPTQPTTWNADRRVRASGAGQLVLVQEGGGDQHLLSDLLDGADLQPALSVGADVVEQAQVQLLHHQAVPLLVSPRVFRDEHLLATGCNRRRGAQRGACGRQDPGSWDCTTQRVQALGSASNGEQI